MSFAFPVSPTNGQTHTITSGRIYTWNGEAWTLPNTRTGLPGQQIYTEPGTYEWHFPRHATLVHVQLWGGGGGGAALGGHGGGGGAYAEGWIHRDQLAAELGLTEELTVGRGGYGGTTGTGGAGIESHIGGTYWGNAWVFAKGGGGGYSNSPGLGANALPHRKAGGYPGPWDGGNGGQSAFWGGAGGAQNGDMYAPRSVYGGHGGGTGQPGAPRGGGGCSGPSVSPTSTDGKDGGRGEVRVTVFG